MSRLHLYTVFHCNLAFSSIPEDDYPEIIRNCYWPLLELAQEGVPVGIEASAHTLIEIAARDAGFVERLAELWRKGRCEFIGSGYSQMIMPLSPADVNGWNLEAGNRRYRELLGRAPQTAYVNEQAYSRGIAELYRRAGCKAIIMDWDNCFRHNHYPKQYQFYPQRIAGGGDINVVWNNSIAFQKFQRCVHGEITEKDYLEYLFSHYSENEDRAFLLYGNDAEVFGYRPGQGVPNADARKKETEMLKALIRKAAADERVEMITPGAVPGLFKDNPFAYNRISLEAAENPITVKKQDKYNPTRWAVTGRDSVHVNTECHRVYDNIRSLAESGMPDGALVPLKEALCHLWGSDFRTNTIDEKFLHFQNRLGWLKLETERLLAGSRKPAHAGAPEGLFCPGEPGAGSSEALKAGGTAAQKARIVSTDKALRVCTSTVEAEFLTNKGCAIRSLAFPKVSSEPMAGTLSQGYYDDIHFGADFFSGHLIHVSREGVKTTDLKAVEPRVEEYEDRVAVIVQTPLDIGMLWKRYDISKTASQMKATYRLKVNGLAASSLRLGILTLIPDGFDGKSLWFETVNGGPCPERFYLAGHTIAHSEPVSQSVSASGCLGATEGWVSIGDRDKHIRVHTDKSRLYSAPMLSFREFGPDNSFFLRLYHSLGEVDDTAWWVWRGYNETSFTISGHKNG